MKKKHQNFYLFVLLCLMFFLHKPVSNEWLWDDKLLIEGNQTIHNFDYVAQLWFQDLWYGALGEHPKHFYRPMVVFDFWLDLQTKPSPTFMKWHSLLWHVAAIVLSWFFFQKQLLGEEKQRICFLFLPALHPFSLEVTQFISARNDVMSWCLSILTGLCIVHRSFFLAMVSALFALLSKEIAVVYLVFVISYLYIMEPENKRQMKTMTLCILIAMLLYMFLRSIAGIESPSFYIPKAITGFNYLSCILQPNQCPTAMPEPSELSTTGIFIFLLLVMWVHQSKSRFSVLALVFSIISIILASSAVQLSEGMAHRYLYGSLYFISFALFAGWNKRLSLYLGISIALFSFYNSLLYRHHWTSSITIFQHALELGNHKKTACALFKEYETKGKYDKAVPLLEYALQNPPDPYCCLNASRFGMVIDNPEASIYFGEMGLRNGCVPTVEIYSPLAMSYLLVGDIPKVKLIATKITDDPYDFLPIIWSTLEILGEDLTERPDLLLTNEEKEIIFRKAQGISQRIQDLHEHRTEE